VRPPATEFGALLRHWRETRRFSQLDLALQADVSSKHVSFLETGRNQPSREMILRLAQAMDVPLRDRNLLLNVAGFASVYNESTIDAPEIGQAQEALSRILEKQDPYPAIVVDSNWILVRQNKGADAMGQFLLPGAPSSGFNVLELLFSEEGLQPFVVNWEEVSATLLMRIHRDALTSTANQRQVELLERLADMPATPDDWQEIASRLPAGPTVNLVLKKDDIELSFFTTVTTFGTPQDVTLQELRIESYFPSDQATRDFCNRWLDSGPG
jgi:transcriptional regulator with XRE-family HTH domain